MCITNNTVKSNIYSVRLETTITTSTASSVIMNEVRWAVRQTEKYQYYSAVVEQMMLVNAGMSQLPRGDSSDFVVELAYDTSRRDTFQPFIDELRTFVDGK